MAQTFDEIGEYSMSCLVIEFGSNSPGTNVNSPSLVNDKGYNTVFRETAHADQYIKYDWSNCEGPTEINAIMVETDENKMSSG